MTQALSEVQAAARAGFVQWRHFVLARRTNQFPPPVREVPGIGPVWNERQIDEWLGVTQPDRRSELAAGEEEAIRRVRDRKKAPMGR